MVKLYLMVVKICSIALDDKTKHKLDKYAQSHAISRSAAIRLVVNEFFLKQEV